MAPDVITTYRRLRVLSYGHYGATKATIRFWASSSDDRPDFRPRIRKESSRSAHPHSYSVLQDLKSASACFPSQAESRVRYVLTQARYGILGAMAQQWPLDNLSPTRHRVMFGRPLRRIRFSNSARES